MKSSLIRPYLAVIVVACAALPGASAHAQTPAGVTQIASKGFPEEIDLNGVKAGGQLNSYAWSMAWFKGKLYVGTARHAYCVEAATLDFYFPDQGHYSSQRASDLQCPANKYDLDLRAEIWAYTPTTQTWKLVFKSPADIVNPRDRTKWVARDIGFRGMLVYKEPNGQEALYVGGVTVNEYIPELSTEHPPRILRTTDGISFTPLPTAPNFELDTAFGKQWAIGYRAMVQYDGRMFVTASGGLLGDGVILEVGNPSGPAPTYKQVSPVGMQVFEMETFDGELYAGTGDFRNGYSVFKTDATNAHGAPPYTPYQYTPIVTGGAGRGFVTTSVVAMRPFKGNLYVGASGWYGTTAQSELIRVKPDDSWDLVVGNPRIDWGTLQYKHPISNLPDGFGNPFNAHFWRMQEHDGELQLGTNDWSWAMRDLPGSSELAKSQFGFDIFASCDGVSWYGVTSNAFDDGLYNFGARTIASSSFGRFTGSANHAQGAAVWRQSGSSPCAQSASAASTTSASSPSVLSPPQGTRAAMNDCGTQLSWRSSEGASGYSILRSEYKPTGFVPVLSPALPSGFRFDPAPSSAGVAQVDGGTPAAGRPAFINKTTATSFTDTAAKPPRQYLYHVVAENGPVRSLPAVAVASPGSLLGGRLPAYCG